MKVKISSSGMAASASQSVAEHARTIYDSPGKRWMAVVELAHDERTEPAPNSEREPSVTLRITGLEIPNREQDHVVREVQRALYLQRTARGTLDDDGTLTLSPETLRLAAGQLHAIDSAFLRAAIRNWAGYTRRARSAELTITQLREELENIADGLELALSAAPAEDQD